MIMKSLSYLRALAAKLFHRSAVEDDLDEELRSHLRHRADDLVASGFPRAEAERQARLEFGGRERFKEEVRETFGGNFIEVLIHDLRYSIRVLRKSPGFTTVAVLTLALAIGANAVVFSILNALILRPLNLPQPQSLYGIERLGQDDPVQSVPDYIDLRDRNRSFDSLAAYRISEVGFDAGDNTARSLIYEVSGNYFDTLRIQPYLGRFFHSADEKGPNSAPYIVLGYTFWQNRFQGDRGVVGRVVQLNKHPFTIIGVAPPGFQGTLVFFNADFYSPMVNQEQVDGRSVLNARNIQWIYLALGHLKPGVTPAQAVADLNSIGSYLEKTYPKEDGHVRFGLSRPSLYGDYLGSRVETFLTGLMLFAGLILLAACANLGSLFAARAADRSREIALRLALGAKRNRILRTLFTEAMLISVLGGALGLCGSFAILRGLSAWQPIPRYPLHVTLIPDANVYAVAVALALLSGFFFALVPVRQVLRTDPYQIVKSSTTGMPRRRITARDLLLVVQIAICALLVTSSFVAVRGLVRSLHSDFGFEPRNAMVVDTDLSMAGHPIDRAPEVEKRIIDAIQSIPGVQSVGLTDWVPLISGAYGQSDIFSADATDLRPANAITGAFRFRISPELFQAAKTPLLDGRPFSWHDEKNSPRVAIVNPEFARRVFGSRAGAVGKFFKLADGARVQVVGLAQDGKYKGIAEDQKAAMYLPIQQSPALSIGLIVRSNNDPGQLTAAIRATLHDLDRGLPVYIQTWTQELSDFAFFPTRIATVSLGVLGVLGAMLSITGIFGMAAYSVSRRLKELGIRLALGAQRKEILSAALGRAVKLLGYGSAAGLALGILASRVLSNIVYQATPRDPFVLTAVVLAMALLGLLATWIPAQRALSLDPLVLLRDE